MPRSSLDCRRQRRRGEGKMEGLVWAERTYAATRACHGLPRNTVFYRMRATEHLWIYSTGSFQIVLTRAGLGPTKGWMWSAGHSFPRLVVETGEFKNEKLITWFSVVHNISYSQLPSKHKKDATTTWALSCIRTICPIGSHTNSFLHFNAKQAAIWLWWN